MGDDAMVVIDGVRYRAEDAKRLGLVPAPAADDKKRTPENDAPPAQHKARRPKGGARGGST